MSKPPSIPTALKFRAELKGVRRVLALVGGYLSTQPQDLALAWDGGIMTYGELREHINAALKTSVLMSKHQRIKTVPPITTSLRAVACNCGYNQTQMAKRLGLMQSHYSEVLSGKIELPKNAMRKAYRLGVPAEVLLQ